MIAYGEHPADAERACAACERDTPHLFRETRIAEPRVGVGGALVEEHLVECVVCGRRHFVEGDAHPDYGVDELGWVVARRATPAVRETVRPGAAWADAGAP